MFVHQSTPSNIKGPRDSHFPLGLKFMPYATVETGMKQYPKWELVALLDSVSRKLEAESERESRSPENKEL